MGIVQPPTGGLVGSSNYNLYDNCENLTGVSVTVDVTQEMVAIPSAPSAAGIQSNGIAFQLNCLPPAGDDQITWQQYIMVVSRTGEDLRWGVNNWNNNPAITGGIINQGGDLATLPSPLGGGYASIPVGYRLEIALSNDPNNDNVTGVTFSMYDRNGAPVFQPKTVTLTSLTDANGNLITAAELSPIVDIDFLIVGYANGADTTLSQGAGTITYRATNSLTVLNTFPPCTAGVNTAESSNVRYGELDSSASAEIDQTFQVPLVSNFVTFQPVQVGNMVVYVLGSDGNLWYETGPFGGQIPPNRLPVDGNVGAFQALDGSNVFVLGSDGNLWLETWPFGNVAETIQTRLQLDGNVGAFQAVSSGFGQKVFVLGNDRNLWWEPWPTGDVAETIAERQIIDADVQAFQALDVYDVIVLGGDGNLWFEGLPFGSIAQTIQNRKQIDANVKAFQPIDAYNIYVLGNDGTLWFEWWPVPMNSPSFDGWGNVQETIALRKIVDQNVAAFQAIDVNTVFVLGTDGNLWLETSPWGDVGQTTATPVDSGVAAFYAWAAAYDFFGSWVVLVKDTNDNLWYETPPAPPQTSWRDFEIDGNVM